MAIPIRLRATPMAMISLFPITVATGAIKGGPKIAAVDAIITVSLSILKMKASRKCSNTLPKTTKPQKRKRLELADKSSVKLAIDPIARAKTSNR